MFEMLASVFSGGITGIFGSIAQKVGDYFQQKQEYAHDEKMREMDMQEIQLEKDAAIAKTEAMSEAQQDMQAVKNEGAAWEQSYKHDSRAYATGELTDGQRSWMVVVDVLRGAIRPLLTMYLAGVATYMVVRMNSIVGGMDNINPAQVEKLWWQVTITVLYIASTSITWWFGSRAKVKPAKDRG